MLFYIAAVSATKQEGVDKLDHEAGFDRRFESGLIFTLMFILAAVRCGIELAMSLGVVVGTIQRVTALVAVLRSLEAKEMEVKTQ